LQYVAVDKLSRKEVDYVLRRAAEIDSGPGEPGRALESTTSEPALTVSEVMRLGAEVGLRTEAMLTALAEIRHGAMIEPETGPLARALGPGRVVVSRLVPGPPDVVGRAVERFLRDQLMTVRRHHGDRIEWERAQGIWPGLLRSLDFSKRYGFSLVSRVETTIVAEGGGTAVTFNIDLSESRRERFTHMGVRSLLAFAVVGLGGTALLPGFGVADALALAGGGIAAGSVFTLDRRRYLESRERAVLAPERFLDLLVHDRRRITAPAPPLPSEGTP
jgi:hypothetical protein